MPLTGVGIRRAGVSDFAVLSSLTEYGGACSPKNEWWNEWQNEWRERLRSPEVFSYLVEDKEVFGFVTAGPSLLLDDSDGELLGLFLNPDHRGVGMGKKLLVRGLSVLKRRNFSRAVVFIANQDVVMKGLLMSLGFETDIGDREINHPQGTVLQVGFGLGLNDYF